MAKLSVSVPDRDWVKVRILYPDLGPSEVVQKAISVLIKDVKPTPEQLEAFWEKHE